MKKQIVVLTTTALLTLGGLTSAKALVEDVDIDIDTNVDLSDLSIYTTFDYETEYVFRGQQLADHSFQPSVEASIQGFYVGLWSNLPIVDEDDKFTDEIDLYLGCITPLGDLADLDLGFTYYWYPDSENFVDRSREFKAGLAFDVPFSPSVYYYYDIDLEQSTVELFGSKAFDLSEWVNNTSFEIGAHMAYLDTDELDAGQSRFVRPGRGNGNGYIYWGATADVVYSFTETASGKVGIRYAGNNDDNSDIDTQTGEREDSLWWGISFTAGF